MTEQDWGELRWFGMEERNHRGEPAFSEPLEMEVVLMRRLDRMRGHIGKPFQIHASWSRDGHSEDSQHYTGNAVDGVFLGLSAVEAYLVAEAWNWPGLGFYPDWGGIHVDNRVLPATGKGARWWRDRRGVYREVTPEVIRRFLK